MKLDQIDKVEGSTYFIFEGFDLSRTEVITIRTWCKENCKDMYDVFEYDLIGTLYKALLVYIILEEDAIAFKLRWM